MIVVEHYSNDGRLKNIIEGNDAATTCATLVDMQLVSQIDHAAYMGRELARAETCLLLDTQYIQDKAQGEIDCQTRKLIFETRNWKLRTRNERCLKGYERLVDKIDDIL